LPRNGLLMHATRRKAHSVLGAFLASGLTLALVTAAVREGRQQDVNVRLAGDFSKSACTVSSERKPILKLGFVLPEAEASTVPEKRKTS
jgi:hypothetical protein